MRHRPTWVVLMTQSIDAVVRLVLEGALTMRTADTVRATLRQALDEPPAAATAGGSIAGVLIDCTTATEIDLTFIQLLIACRISADAMNKSLALAAAPDGALLDTLTRGGFQAVCDGGTGKVPAYWFERANS
jgi:hypothetical protein